jgi:hypothetical protein
VPEGITGPPCSWGGGGLDPPEQGGRLDPKGWEDLK